VPQSLAQVSEKAFGPKLAGCTLDQMSDVVTGADAEVIATALQNGGFRKNVNCPDKRCPIQRSSPGVADLTKSLEGFDQEVVKESLTNCITRILKLVGFRNPVEVEEDLTSDELEANAKQFIALAKRKRGEDFSVAEGWDGEKDDLNFLFERFF
jgi:hypothetical protein